MNMTTTTPPPSSPVNKMPKTRASSLKVGDTIIHEGQSAKIVSLEQTRVRVPSTFMDTSNVTVSKIDSASGSERLVTFNVSGQAEIEKPLKKPAKNWFQRLFS